MATPEELKNSLTNSWNDLKVIVETQVKEALNALGSVSKEASDHGVAAVSEISRVGVLLVEGKIDQESAALAIDNYVQVIKLIGSAEANAVKAQAYKRGLYLLETVKAMVLSLLKMAVDVAIPQAGTLISGLLKVA